MLHAAKTVTSVSSDRLQVLVFIGLSLGVFGFTGILYFSNRLLFRRFLGRTNPLIAFLFAIVLGFVLLSFLLSQKWFAIYREGNLKGVLFATGLAALFGVIMILVDTRIVFAADTNVLFPESLLFYPAMGFFAEVVFHVLPLTVLLVILNATLKNLNFETIVWIVIPIVAMLEPMYQARAMAASKQFPGWAVAYVGLHIFLINLLQLSIFKTHDFISMYAFRFVYYLFWHIGWGYLRLQWLF